MLIVEIPNTRIPERDYILSVLLGDFLGMSWTRQSAERGDVRITVADQQGELLLPEGLFRTPEAVWLTTASLPSRPLPRWDVGELGNAVTLVEKMVPVIFGDAQPGIRQTKNGIRLPIDIFGSAFFMLSRYEEAVLQDRDKHDRFPANASLAYRADFLDRPLIDEYVEILWVALQQLWPGLRRKDRKPRTLVSCDIDSPYAFNGSITDAVRYIGNDLLKHRSIMLAYQAWVSNWHARRGDYALDPHRIGVDWIMDINEQIRQKVAFFFIPKNTDSQHDKSISLNDPRMRHLLRDIYARGHEIGIHPGYHTYKHPEEMTRTVTALRRALAEEGIDQPLIGGRQHYLRWETPTTARLWDDNGLSYDSTLCFAECPGFRCGTCHEYPLYDLEQRCSLKLRERPLIMMECSIIARRYLGLGYSGKALALMLRYRDICHRFGGNFTLLWHNSHLTTASDRQFYQALLS